MSDTCKRGNNEYYTIKLTHDRLFKKPLLGCLNYLKMLFDVLL